ncbi:MAG: hypothetical protein GY757_03575 [bacterium]|nr:hypothetical protein [bacterium]
MKQLCRFYKIMYNLFPFTKLQSLIMDTHLSLCPDCRKQLDVEPVSGVDSIGLKAESVDPGIDIWSTIENRLDQADYTKNKNPVPAPVPGFINILKKQIPVMPGLTAGGWAVAGVALVLLLLIPFLYLQDSGISGKSNKVLPQSNGELLSNRDVQPVNTDLGTENNGKIIINSVKVENRPAKTIYFQPNNKDRLIVWVKRS